MRHVIVCLLCLGLFGCVGARSAGLDEQPDDSSDDGSGTAPAAGSPEDAAPVGTASAEIDENGGTLRFNGAELQFPPGAVGAAMEVTISELGDDAVPAGFRAGSAVYRFEPAGLRFEQPVTVTLPLSSGQASDGQGEELALFWSNDAGGFDSVDDARIEDGVMVGQIEHFSYGFVGALLETDGVDGGAGGGQQTPCVRGGRCDRVLHSNVSKVDLLFMVDNSGSMREEQAALAAQFPRMMRALTTGDLDDDGTPEFPPVDDLHVGVVSSDMGLVGIAGIPGCEGLGDDGALQSQSSDNTQCTDNQPPFVSFDPGRDTPEDAAEQVACLTSLGTQGCGFEQQLESVLKAVTPSDSQEITFLGDVNGFGRVGQGAPNGVNAGFLRNDPEDPSLLAVVLVTDEEDCSAHDTRLFTPDIYLDPTDPLAMQDLNLRCFYNEDDLYPVSRYVEGLKRLRPSNENLVIFAAIAGVPPALVTESALAGYDLSDDADRERFYDDLLDADEMQEMEDPNRTPEQGGNLTPSCVTETGRAYPPRRIVEVARGFGVNGVVQSICQSDFAPAIDPILQRVASQLGGACLEEALQRGGDGTVACDLLWELSGDGAPESCDALPFLSAGPEDGVCVVEQLAAQGTAPAQGEGWYYDDFSTQAQLCPGDSDQAVAFTAAAVPPSGVRAYLDCD
ncbi:MAG: hypothetical protein PVI30_26730 [Myxococcales bacterium]|jgi:hypothetical protein